MNYIIPIDFGTGVVAGKGYLINKQDAQQLVDKLREYFPDIE